MTRLLWALVCCATGAALAMLWSTPMQEARRRARLVEGVVAAGEAPSDGSAWERGRDAVTSCYSSGDDVEDILRGIDVVMDVSRDAGRLRGRDRLPSAVQGALEGLVTLLASRRTQRSAEAIADMLWDPNMNIDGDAGLTIVNALEAHGLEGALAFARRVERSTVLENLSQHMATPRAWGACSRIEEWRMTRDGALVPR